jgi:hypothetical protein
VWEHASSLGIREPVFDLVDYVEVVEDVLD